MASSRVGISFCTTCRNRLWQLKGTLNDNLASLRDIDEIVLIDYGSSDGLSEWVWSNFRGFVESGKLVFFEVTSPVQWNVARAKNLAHRLASGNYLFNLDADNFVTALDLVFIKFASDQGIHCHQWSGDFDDGSFGRIGLPRDLFTQIGGYDETLLPMGGQDVDILNRIASLGLRRLNIEPTSRLAIQNSKAEKMGDIGGATQDNSKDFDELYKKMNSLNLHISDFKLKTQGAVRLGGGFSYRGLLNDKPVAISGFDEISKVIDE